MKKIGIVYTFVLLLTCAHASPPLQLFEPINAASSKMLRFSKIVTDPTVKSISFVRLNTSVLERIAHAQTVKDATLDFTIDIPGKKRYSANALKVTHAFASPSTILKGRIDDNRFTHISLVVTHGKLYGSLRTPEGTLYKIRPVGKYDYCIEEINEEALPPLAPPKVPLQTNFIQKQQRQTNLTAYADPPDTFDVMVVYTTAAKNAAGGTDAIEAIAQSSIATMNTTFENSQIPHRVRLVHMAEVDYTRGENGTVSGFDTALNDLTGTMDGYMDEVHQLRDDYHADMVQLFFNNSSLGGLAWVMTLPSENFDESAFSVVHYNAADGWAFDHELGHNMGMVHDRDNSNFEGSYSYSYGYQSPTNAWHTVMAYSCASWCPRIDYWSNPEVIYNGEATGISIGETGEADAKTTIQNNALYIANWRQRNPQPDLVIAYFQLNTTEVLPSSNIQLSVVVANQGNTFAEATQLNYYVSVDATITSSDTLIQRSTVASLSADDSNNFQITVQAPQVPGEYYFGACVVEVTNEVTIQNNCSQGVLLKVLAETSDDE